MNAIRIVIVDDHSVVRRGIKSLLSNHDDFDVVGEADTAQSALRLVAELVPDIVLLDIRLPDESGLDLLARIRHSATKVLILTSFDDEEHLVTALQRGAYGFVLKSVSDDMLCGAIRTVYEGGRVLSQQITERVGQQLATDGQTPDFAENAFSDDERQLIRLLVAGASNDQMAVELFMSVASIKRKLRVLFDRLNVQNRAQAAAVIVQRNLI